MTNTEKTQALNDATKAIIDDMAKTLKPIVQGIEASIKTTQNHYAQYLSILTQFKDKHMRRIVVIALIQAGANQKGVNSAFEIL
tara:strand:+ start:478 stop:729 length:252 start_codon:yes stop_codon:yes gene_type:complete